MSKMYLFNVILHFWSFIHLKGLKMFFSKWLHSIADKKFFLKKIKNDKGPIIRKLSVDL